MTNLKLRLTIAVVGILLSLVWLSPNFLNLEKLAWWPVKNKLNFGLDIQGGLHLVMGVDVDGVVAESTNRLVLSLAQELRQDNITAEVSSSNPSAGEVEFKVASKEMSNKVVEFLGDKYAAVLQVLSADASVVKTRYYEAYLSDYKSKVIHQAIETIRNRIDEFGVAEPSIAAQGSDRILVQLPGLKDAEQAKALINTTAKLDFMIVDESVAPQTLTGWISEAEKNGGYSLKDLRYSEYVSRLNADLKSKLPPNTMVLFEKADGAPDISAGALPHVVRTDTNLGGDSLDSAFVTFGQYGEPEVALRFNPAGANKFAEITGANVGKRMAIVLDRVVKSAPSIRDRIGGGNAVITLGGRDREKSMAEANMIATALRAGALPASLEQLEERRVGPSLGADSVKAAQTAALVGGVLVLLFMIVYYKGMGVVAAIGTILNLAFLLGLLTSLGATLTLPGIAGIALTVGMAVDANVLINERIREELAVGSSMKLAIKQGYARAMSAILDSNITTAATAVVLLYFGTGPIRGFAVTLLIGICSTLFANVFVSKAGVDFLIERFGVKRISV